MKNELRDILSNLNKDSGQEKLLEYLNRQLNDETCHNFEKEMADDQFINDAVEGLENFRDKESIEKMVLQLNLNLKKQIETRNKRKEKRRFRDQPWAYVGIFLILMLIIAAYIVIRKINAG